MMRNSRKLAQGYASLSLLTAGIGCLSMEPISSYSEGRREVAEIPSALEPEPEAPAITELEAAEVAEAPAEPEPQISEGLPGDGEIALEPGMAQEPPAEPPPEPLPTCAAEGEFASPDGVSCYLASSQDATWPDALASCEEWGGSLVRIDSREEDTLLGERVSETFWTAASDRVQEGRMFWAGGTPLTFTNWTAGQPDDFQGREDCVVKTAPAGTWNDRPCGNVFAYVCERTEA